MVESTFEPNITVESVGQAIRAHLSLKLTRKPSREEFLTIAKVAGRHSGCGNTGL